KKLAADLLETQAGPGGGDVCDAASDGTQNELHSQLAALESRELGQIEQAILMIRQGRYGLCDMCGSRIPIARLKALPFTPLCIDCQRKQELTGGRTSSFDVNWETAYEFEGAANDREVSLGDIEIDYSE